MGLLNARMASSEGRMVGRFSGIRGGTEPGAHIRCNPASAAPPRKDEVDRRQEFAMPKTLDHGEQVVLRRPPELEEPVVRRGFRLGPLASLARDAAVLVEQGVEPSAHREPGPKLDRPFVL